MNNFNENGYFIVPKFLAGKECDDLIEESLNLSSCRSELSFDDLEYPYSSIGDFKRVERFLGGHQYTKRIKKIYEKNFTVYGKIPVDVTCEKIVLKSKYYGSYEPYHQESSYFKTGQEFFRFKQCVVALVDLDHCPINIFAGSHKLGEYEHHQIMERSGMSKFAISSNLLDELSGFISLNLNRGDLLIMDFLLIHGSPSNSFTIDQPRAIFRIKDCNGSSDVLGRPVDRSRWEFDTLINILHDRVK